MWINIKKKGEKSMNLNANSTFPKTQKNPRFAEIPRIAKFIFASLKVVFVYS